MANNKKQIPKDELKELYLVEGLSMEKISKKYGVSRGAIRNRIIEYGINKPIAKKHISKDELFELYIIENLSVKEIANVFHESTRKIQRELAKNSIKKPKELLYSKIKQVVKNKYNVDNISQIDEVKEKKKQIAINKYGVENISQLEIVKKKKEIKSLEKYGTKSVLQAKSIREKQKETIKKKYGVENIQQCKQIREKVKKTNIERYGVEYPLQSDAIKEKIKKTNIKKYGVECVLNSPIIKAKISKINKERYGNYNNFKNPIIQEKIKQTCMERYGVPYACMTKQCRKVNGNANSKINQKFSKKLNENGINNKLEKPLFKYSYDIELIEQNILIEINPTYTHNYTYGSEFRGHKKAPLALNYHYNKSITATENGYRCIHVWDWDDYDKIINILKPKAKIYARKCDIKEISNEECFKFINQYHLQGNCMGQIIKIGLFYNNELIEVMTFGKPRYNKKYEWELLRLCTSFEYQIIGGANKMFKYFISKYNPKNIISYCDNSKFNGNVYKILGFNLLDYGKPSKHWYNIKTKRHITDNLLRQRGFDQLFKTNYGKGSSNEELMLNNGFVEIYDCGQSTYIYNK